MFHKIIFYNREAAKPCDANLNYLSNSTVIITIYTYMHIDNRCMHDYSYLVTLFFITADAVALELH